VKTIGIDIGRANTGLVIFDNDEKSIVANATIQLPIAKVRKVSPFNATSHRLYFLQQNLKTFILGPGGFKKGDKALAVIEDYAYGDQRMTLEQFRKMDKMSLEVGEAHGIVYAALAEIGIPMIKVAPSQMKYFIAGDGQCEKTQIIKTMHKTYRVPLDDDHQYDALALCHMGRYYIIFCSSPGVIKEGTYEYNTMINIAFDMRHAAVSKIFGLKL